MFKLIGTMVFLSLMTACATQGDIDAVNMRLDAINMEDDNQNADINQLRGEINLKMDELFKKSMTK